MLTAPRRDRKRYVEASIGQSAKQLLDHPEISLRIAALRASAADKAIITLEQHLFTLANLRDKAAQTGQMGAAITAEIARGKAAGLYVERREVNARMTAVVEVGDD